MSLFSNDEESAAPPLSDQKPKTHLVTGATGFVGSALVLDLLAKTDDRILCIVREPDGTSATTRLRDALYPLIDGYQLNPALRPEIDNRVEAIAGNIELADCGVDQSQLPRGVEFWHSAASLQHDERRLTAIETTNVEGTTNAVKLAAALETSAFNMISTAYVAGSQEGLIGPGPQVPTCAVNAYERSKIKAEEVVVNSGVRYRICRPSIVIGHSKTMFSTSSDGMYGMLRHLTKYARLLERAEPGSSKTYQTSVVANSASAIDLVPVDHVAHEAVALHQADAPQGYYHLTNPTPPTVGFSLDIVFQVAGLRPPKKVQDPSLLSAIDLKFHDRIDFYSSYLNSPKLFDRSTTEEALGTEAAPGFALEDSLSAYCQWYVDEYALVPSAPSA